MHAANSEVRGQIRKFYENFGKLLSELTVAKQVNSVLFEMLISMEINVSQTPSTLGVSA